MSKFKDFLNSEIKSGEINLTEARRLGHFAELGNLNARILRNNKVIQTTRTPKTNRPKPTNELIRLNSPISRLLPGEAISVKRLSFDDLDIDKNNSNLSVFLNEIPHLDQILNNMSAFTIADFHRVIPEFKGDPTQLSIFLRRCDAFHDSLNDAGKLTFISHLIFKLAGKAFLIFESKDYRDWPSLKTDLLEGIKVGKSVSAIQNEIVTMK